MSVLKVYNGVGWEQAIPASSSSGLVTGDDAVTLPASPSGNEIFEYVGTGNIWTITANTGQYIRFLSVVSGAGGYIRATSGYDCVMLVYIGSNTWLVKSHEGTLNIT